MDQSEQPGGPRQAPRVPPEPPVPPTVGMPAVGDRPAGHGSVRLATGTTSVTEAAVAKIAAAAARGVEGVHSLGVGGSRALGALRGAVSGPEPSVGVAAEVGTTQAAIDIVLTAEYGRPLHAIATDVREAVHAAVERLTGLVVIEVNIEIGDVQLPAAGGRHAPAGEGP